MQPDPIGVGSAEQTRYVATVRMSTRHCIEYTYDTGELINICTLKVGLILFRLRFCSESPLLHVHWAIACTMYNTIWLYDHDTNLPIENYHDLLKHMYFKVRMKICIALSF